MRSLLVIAALLIAQPAFAQAINPGRPAATYARTATQTGYKWFDDRKTSPNCNGCVFQNMTITPSRTGIEITKSTPITVQNVVFKHSKPTTKEGDYPAGIQVSSGTGTLTVGGSTFEGFERYWPAADYDQGDGLVCNARGSFLILLDGNRFIRNKDGGLDNKCQLTATGTQYFEGNYRNVRNWGPHTFETVVSTDPRNAHVWYSAGGRGSIDKLVASGGTGAAVFYFSAVPATYGVGECVFNFSVPTKAFKGVTPKDYKDRMHPSCWPDAKGFAVNTIVEVPDITGLCAFKTALNDNDGDGVIRLGTANRKLCGVASVRLLGQNRAGQYVYDIAK